MLNKNPNVEVPVNALVTINLAVELLGDELDFFVNGRSFDDTPAFGFRGLDHLPPGLRQKLEAAEDDLNAALDGDPLGVLRVALKGEGISLIVDA